MNKQKGFVALSTILIIMAVTLAIATTSALLAIGSLQSSFVLFKGADTLNFVEGCVEDVMLKIRSNSSYSAASITRPEGTCLISYTSTDPNWNITVTTSSTIYKRQIQAQFTRNATGITISSWKEI